MAILKSKYDSIDEVDEKYRDLYEERDGAAIFKRDAVEGVKTQADVDRVQAALKKERERAAAAEKRVSGVDFGERSAEEVQEILDSFEDMRERAESGGKLDDATKEKLGRLTKFEREAKAAQRELDKIRGEAETHKKRAEDLEASIRRATLQSEITRAATSLKMRPEAIEDAVVRAATAFEFGEDGRPLTREDQLAPAEWLQAMKPKVPHWWPESTGGGATGSSGGGSSGSNPFTKGSMNMTAIGQLVAKDPAKADAMARAAGHAGGARAAIKQAAAESAPQGQRLVPVR